MDIYRKLFHRLTSAVASGLIAGMLIVSGNVSADDTAVSLDKAITGSHRQPENVARDRYRHPRETLLFFGLRDDMTVVEVSPGGGWYTEILAPVLRDKGKLYVAHVSVKPLFTSSYNKEALEKYRAKLAAQPAAYDKVIVTEFLPPDYVEIAPPGSADMVLTFRNVHNWAKAKGAEAAFKSFHTALKPGGVLGLVEHRAKPNTSLDDMIASGYMTEAYVIELAERTGFKLAEKSDTSANANDTKDHAKGVWTLPPSFALGDKDREKYRAIGESDRMTLKFIKR